MKFVISRASQLILAAGAICLFVALIIPWAEPVPQKNPATAPVAPAARLAPDQGNPERASSQAIVALFVKKRSPAAGPAVARIPPPPEAKKPVDAPWLNYLGFYSGAPGRSYYLLKDTRSGRVIHVSQTDTTNGWTLVEVSEKRLVIGNKDDVYIVNKR